MTLETLAPILEGITQAFGAHCAAALINLDKKGATIIAIANGEVISRSVGDSADPFWQPLEEGDTIITETVITKGGKKFRCTRVHLPSTGDDPVALLIVADLAVPLIVQDYFRTLLPATSPASPPPTLDLSQALGVLLQEAVTKASKPVALMGKEEKLTVIRHLDEHGAFLLRGSIEDVAKELQISRFTVYNYLDEIRGNSNDD
jgi:predicted transcriptional regulator YheO